MLDTDAVSALLRGILKGLVSSASASLVLSARPAHVHDLQVNPPAGGGCLRALPRGWGPHVRVPCEVMV